MPSPSSGSFEALQRRLQYRFRREALLVEALTHKSCQQEKADIATNQRLEFLGDAVLGLIVTEELFRLYPAEREGVLSRRRATLCNGTQLAVVARELGVQHVLHVSTAEESVGGRLRDAALEDALEALVGAIYTDSDFAQATTVVLGWYGPLPDRLALLEGLTNPKGQLQEIVQPRHGNSALRYEVIAEIGADHAKRFEVAVSLLDRRLGSGIGTSKKNAEEAAARAALESLRLTPLP